MLTLASLFADPLALGLQGTGFGWKQILGTLFGLALSGAGGYVLYKTAEADTRDGKGDDSV